MPKKTKKKPKQRKKRITKSTVLDAVNRMDELACQIVEANDDGSANKLRKDYNMVFDYITKH